MRSIASQDLFVLGLLVAGEGDKLGHVDALIADPFDAADDVKQGGHEPQVGRHGRLGRQQREDSLLDFQVPAVDLVIIRYDHAGQLHVLVGDRLEHSIELADIEV